MTQITLKGNPINTLGELPSISAKAKDFQLVAKDLSSKSFERLCRKELSPEYFPEHRYRNLCNFSSQLQ